MNCQDSFKPAASGLDQFNQAEEVACLKEDQAKNELPFRLNADRVEALLTSIIKITIVELRGAYGPDGVDTCEFVAEREPELCKAVGMTRVMELCRDLHHTADPGLSEWYAARFYQLNKEFFHGCLEEYDVRVVYDPFAWIVKPTDRPVRGHTDFARRQIILGVPYDCNPHQMDALLIYQMAHAKTKTSTCSADWQREMRRLEQAGARVSLDDWQ